MNGENSLGRSLANRSPVRMHVTVRGTVQGVGFRPFVYLVAQQMGLNGWVRNSNSGVDIVIQGSGDTLSDFVSRVKTTKPPLSRIDAIDYELLEPEAVSGFEIRPSDSDGTALIPILPDVATCDVCRKEILDPANRRYRYPFTSCTYCGPRYSIVEVLPYDRPNTSMRSFPLCERCQAEYEDPSDRRFHAQANACPDCGPRMELMDRSGTTLARRDQAVQLASSAIATGRIVAVKGVGGFHLMTSALRASAVEELRRRKQRDEKPFAVMMPSVEMVHRYCDPNATELELLSTPQAPIVLMRRRRGTGVADEVAPGANPYLGAMLPYTPLHDLLMKDIGHPIVATSANLSEEPICTENREALERLGEIADLFLVHDRPIVNTLDDSVARVIAGRPMVLRRARGYAPAPIMLSGEDSADLLAVGAHLNNTAALTVGNQCFISQHIGDLDSLQSAEHAEHVIGRFQRVYDHQPRRVACDLHPDYRSTRYAESPGLPLTRVQHHYAHALSCMVDNAIEGPAIGVCWDGTGDGGDGTVWGGEFLHIDHHGFTRAGHLRTFRLPGGEAAVRESRRSALSVLYETFGREALEMGDLEPVRSFARKEAGTLISMIEKSLNAPLTSSAGRLFDAVSSILGLTHCSSFEGQAAMALEYATDGHGSDRTYPFEVSCAGDGPYVVDWRPALRALVSDLRADVHCGEVATVFHNTLAAMIAHVCGNLGEKRIVLSGGCFQNRYLTERVLHVLRNSGLEVYRHRNVPPNDGGIALGQIAATVRNGREG